MTDIEKIADLEEKLAKSEQKVVDQDTEIGQLKADLEAKTKEFDAFKTSSVEEVKKLKAATKDGEIIREALAFKHKGKTYKFNFPKFSIGDKKYDADEIIKDSSKFADEIDEAIKFGTFISEIKTEKTK